MSVVSVEKNNENVSIIWSEIRDLNYHLWGFVIFFMFILILNCWLSINYLVN